MIPDDVDVYARASSSPAMSDSDSDDDARFALFAGAEAISREVEARRSNVFLKRNLSYVARASTTTATADGTAATADGADGVRGVRTRYAYEGCPRAGRMTRGYRCGQCATTCATFRGLMTHLRASHDLLRYEGVRVGEEVTITMRPRRVNFDDNGMFTPRSAEETRSPNDKEFVFVRDRRGRGGKSAMERKYVFRERVSRAELERTYGGNLLKEVPRGAVWRDVERADGYDKAKEDGRRTAAAEERRRVAALPFKPTVCKKRVTMEESLPNSKPRLPAPSRPLGPFYNSRAFIKMSAVPDVDSDDEIVTPAQIIEDRRVLNDFVDFSREEIDFMEAWNEVAMRFRALADYEAPALCEAFVRVHYEKLRANPAFFKLFTITLFAMHENGIINRRAVVDVLTLCYKINDLRWRNLAMSSAARETESCPIAVFDEFPKFATTLNDLRY